MGLRDAAKRIRRIRQLAAATRPPRNSQEPSHTETPGREPGFTRVERGGPGNLTRRHFDLSWRALMELAHVLIRGAREHNLRSIDVKIPKNR